jgi:hypothetical protein
MKRFTTTLLENMGQQHSVRISISYYSTTRESSDKVYDSLFLRVGALVIQIRNLSGLPLHATLRDTSIVLRVFPTFIRILAILSRSADFLYILRNPLLMKYLNRKKMRKYSLYSMMVECSNLMESLHLCGLRGRISIDYTPDLISLSMRLWMMIYELLRLYHPSHTFLQNSALLTK